MARVLVTGSTDGLGRGSAESLLAQGHDVIVHARNASRAEAVVDLVDRGAGILVADFSDTDEVLETVTWLGEGAPLDAVIHNAGVNTGPAVIPVNVVAPYLLTALLPTPSRHIYLSSGMHRSGRAALDRVDWDGARATASYADSKLFITAFSGAIARRWQTVLSHAVDPGWVATKMGGASAPDDFDLGHQTQDRLATDESETTSGGYWYHDALQKPHPQVTDERFQDELIAALAQSTGVELPAR